MRKRLSLTVLLGLLLTLSLLGCGTKNVGVLDSVALGDERAVAGVTLGGFEVIRCDAEGRFEPALNSTLKLRVEERSGLKALVVGVADSVLVDNVAVEVRYDSGRHHAESAEFHGLLGEEVITGSFLHVPGAAGVGQVCVGDDRPAMLAGDFATVYFADGPSRNVSSNGPHQYAEGVDAVLYGEPPGEALPNFTAVADTDAETVTITWYGSWHLADNNQDKLVTIGDITPLGFFYNENVDENWACVRADSNRDRYVTITDITQIGFYYNQGTDGYIVEASDDVDGAPRTQIADVVWDGAELTPYASPGDVVAGQLATAFNMWQVVVDATSTPVNYNALAALDAAGAADTVRVWVSPYRGTETPADGPAFVDVEVGGGGGLADRLVILDYVIEAVGASGGTGENNDDFVLGDTITAQANTDVTLQLVSISGQWNTGTFDALDLSNAEGMTEDDYYLAFDATLLNLEWAFQNAGAAGFRRTANVLTLASGDWPVTGDPGLASVFPDDDPESDSDTPEGEFTLTLPADSGATVPYPSSDELEVHVYAPITGEIGFDVVVDPAAPEILEYGTEEDPLEELNITEPTNVFMEFAWGSGGEPTSFDDTVLQLWQVNTDTGLCTQVVELENVPGGEPPEPGEYQIFSTGDRADILGQIPGGHLGLNSWFAFRFYDGTTWSSINKPEDLLYTTTPPPPQDLMFIPQTAWPAVDHLQVFYEEPQIRRDPRVDYDIWTGTIVKIDPVAYDDHLKMTGDAFFLQVGDEGLYPKVAVRETANPADITSVDDNEFPDIIAYDQNPGRIVVDIGWITPVHEPGTPTKTYSFKLFNADDSPIGQGVFSVIPIGSLLEMPVGRHWGVNVFDREDPEAGDPELFLADRSYSGHTVNGNDVGAHLQRPEVLWFEFGGGWMYDYQQDVDGAYPIFDMRVTDNVHVKVTDVASTDSYYMELALRVVGLGTMGDLIAIHTVTPLDFERPGMAGHPGLFEPGREFRLELDDPHQAGVEHTYADTLLVVGTNPNTRPHQVHGFVVDGGGAGIPNVEVAITGAAAKTAITDAGGYWSAPGGLANGNYTATPTLAGWTFDPAFRDFTVNSGPLLLDDFVGTST